MLGWLGHWILNLVFGLSRGLEFAPLRDDFFSLAVSCPNVFFPFNLHSVYQIYKSVSFIMVVAPSVRRLRNLLRRIDIWTGDDLRWCIFFPVGQLQRHSYPVVHDSNAAISLPPPPTLIEFEWKNIWTRDGLRWFIFFPHGQLPRHSYPVFCHGDGEWQMVRCSSGCNHFSFNRLSRLSGSFSISRCWYVEFHQK